MKANEPNSINFDGKVGSITQMKSSEVWDFFCNSIIVWKSIAYFRTRETVEQPFLLLNSQSSNQFHAK